MWYDPFTYFDIVGMYQSNPYMWDFILFLMLFVSIGQYVFERKYQGWGANNKKGSRQGKILGVTIGIILALSMLFVEIRTGWYLGRQELAVLPLTILYGLVFFLLYSLFRDLFGMGKDGPGDMGKGNGKDYRSCAAALAFLLTYPALRGMFGDPLMRINQEWIVVAGLIPIALFISFVVVVMCMWKAFTGNMPKKTPEEIQADQARQQAQHAADLENAQRQAEVDAARRGTATPRTPSGEPDDDANGGSNGGGPARPVDSQLYRIINNFIDNTNRLVREFDSFKEAGDDLVDARHDMITNPYPPVKSFRVYSKHFNGWNIPGLKGEHPDPELKTRRLYVSQQEDAQSAGRTYVDKLNDFNKATKNLRNDLRIIANHSDTPRIEQPYRTNFAGACRVYFRILQAYDNYNTQMMNNLHNGLNSEGRA